MELREMLELAALAVGYRHVDYSSCDYDGALGIVLLDENGGQGKNWSPHTDDGDSRRLAVRLNIVNSSGHRKFTYDEDMWSAWAMKDNGDLYFAVDYSKSSDDPLVATRMAVLRCAAEIGKSIC